MYENRKVIVTLTTIPSRYKYIKDVLISLKRQSIKPDEIVLSLPLESIREPCEGDPYKVTEETIKEFTANGITIWRPSKDYGPATKILGLLEREISKKNSEEEEPLLIVFDDDKIYHIDCVKQLLEGWSRNKDCVVARKGSIIIQLSKKSERYLSFKKKYDSINRYHETPIKGSDILEDIEVSLIFGTGGILYRASYFDNYVFDYKKKENNFPEKKLFYTDDIFLSGYLSQKGVIKKVIHFPKNDTINKIDNYRPNKTAVLDFDSKSRIINPLAEINNKPRANKWVRDVLIYYEKYLIMNLKDLLKYYNKYLIKK
jgi:hypothetical protein